MFNTYNQNNYWYSVNGYEGAKNFQVAPNQTVLLIDNQQPYMYMKTADQIGQITIKTFKVEESATNPEKQAQDERFGLLDERLKHLEELITKKLGDKNE